MIKLHTLMLWNIMNSWWKWLVYRNHGYHWWIVVGWLIAKTIQSAVAIYHNTVMCFPHIFLEMQYFPQVCISLGIHVSHHWCFPLQLLTYEVILDYSILLMRLLIILWSM